MANLTAQRLTRHVHPFFRIRISRLPIYLLLLVTICTVYYLTSSENFSPPQSFADLDQHLRDWKRYPTRAGGLDGAPPVKGAVNQLEYNPGDGLARGWQLVRGKRTKHPIEFLIEQGRSKWEGLLARQSKSLEQAVTEYVKRYNRPPPRGFDAWYDYCIKNDIKIVDDYDQINHDIEPFFALSPRMFQDRVKALATTDHTYHISVGPTIVPSLTGERSTHPRAKQLFNLILPLASHLPADIAFHISDHDLGSWILGDDQRELAMTRIRTAMKSDGTGLNAIKFLQQPELTRLENRKRNGHPGWFSACPEDSPALGHDRVMENRRREIDGLDPLPDPPTPAFLADPRPAFDFCQNPITQKLHGTMSFDFPRETVLRPIFVLSKFSRNNEFLFPPMEAYENATTPEARKKFQPWEAKTINKLFWRGSSTGDSYSVRKNYDWRRSHRPRLHLMMQNETGNVDIWIKHGREWAEEEWSTAKVNEYYMDVGLTGKPHQCNQADGTCDEMAKEIKFKDRVQPEDAAKYKYVLDVDGNGWSSRLHRLMISGSVVVKNTIFPEWHHDWMTPWVHYIPMQLDYSDLYNIMAFFVGSPDGRQPGRDDLAQQIAEQGKKFAEEHWRWENMQAYMFRLLLEYSRLLADDRDAWSFSIPGMPYPGLPPAE